MLDLLFEGHRLSSTGPVWVRGSTSNLVCVKGRVYTVPLYKDNLINENLEDYSCNPTLLTPFH